VHSGVVDTDSTPDVQIITPLEEYLSKHRFVKTLIPFSTLNPSCRKVLYGKAAIYFKGEGANRSRIFLQPTLSHVRSV
jgi:hypothetical protein